MGGGGSGWQRGFRWSLATGSIGKEEEAACARHSWPFYSFGLRGPQLTEGHFEREIYFWQNVNSL